MIGKLKALPLLGFNVLWTYESEYFSIEKSMHYHHHKCKAAANVKEALKLIETGYEYACELEHVKLFRKRK